MKKILFVLTSNDKMGNSSHKTGFWIEEFTAPYYLLKDLGFDITIASPKGGQPPIDPNSESKDASTTTTERFKEDKETQKALANSKVLSEITMDDYDAVFYPGGHGLLWDLVEDGNSIKLIEDFYNARKPIAFVCHSPAVLKHVKGTDGQALVQGKNVTGFTNGEEAAVELSDVVPFLLEDMLVRNGGNYSKTGDWKPYAVEDGLLITGQNPASSEKVAEILAKKLHAL